MSDDLAQGILCLSFTAPAIAILFAALMKRDIGGTDIDNSAPLLEDEEPVREPVPRSRLARRISALSIAVCLTLIGVLTIVTIVLAGSATASSGKCPLGF